MLKASTTVPAHQHQLLAGRQLSISQQSPIGLTNISAPVQLYACQASKWVTGVLKYKRQSEELLMQSGLPYTILRPGRLTDGPYTSYDLNTLLQATAGNRQDIQVAAGDELNGETSRIALAGVLSLPLPGFVSFPVHSASPRARTYLLHADVYSMSALPSCPL